MNAICTVAIVIGSGMPMETTPTEDKSTARRPGLILEEFVFTDAPFASCHAATIAQVPGNLICAFFGGTAEGDPDVGIWVNHKVDGRWTQVQKVADGIQSPQLRYPTWNPVLFQPKGGDLILFYKVGPSPSRWWGMVTTSSDGGWTWTPPRPLQDRQGGALIGPVKNKPIQLDDGTILAPSSREDNGWRVHIEASLDNGRTWESLTGPINDPNQLPAIQPTLLRYPDGRIQMLCRSGSIGKILTSWSCDGGKTWSAMQPTVLPNPNSGIDAITLSDGRQLLVYNHSTRNQPGTGHKGRGILNVALSHNGRDWQAAMVLEYLDSPESQFSYPAAIQTPDGLVHIVYTWHRKRIKHVVLDPAKLQSVSMPDGHWPDAIQP
ncbi:MAG: exo-alpha-sialidase [Sedimentisphaerales bacterium]|nr:exo-alpha-sialidase [Sedimentisphaerales bacterium]